ncbi:hypothetical protein ACFBZI_10360 [Moraxella sp. ZJ142]|uniref:hypothetical protein n=1 Tax=Moraxella marmotae TaxID=3344520 RepID=UPI0035D4628F
MLTKTEKQAINAPNAVFNGYLNALSKLVQTLLPSGARFDGSAFENFPQSHKLTADGKIRLVPTAGCTLGHMAVVVNMDDHYILLAGDASYCEKDMLVGNIDGVCMDGTLHQQSTARMRELCQHKPTITQSAHDEKSGYLLENRIFTVMG